MKYNLLLIILLSITLNANSQTWSKISTNIDSLWTNSVKYYNSGDTIIYYGSKTGTGAFNAKQFYVSTDGGVNFTRDFTKLDAIGYTPIYTLPINKTLIGFKNSPNVGSYNFLSINSWGSLLLLYTGLWGEIDAGNLIFQATPGSNLYKVSYPSGNIVGQVTFPNELICTYNSDNRLFLGAKKNNIIQFVDNGNFSSIQTSTIENLGLGASVLRFFKSVNTLYAVVFDGQDKLYKSVDNGVSWTRQNTSFYKNGVLQPNLVSVFTIGTPNGNIFFITNSGNSDDVFLSIDGGTTANKVGVGLPSNGLKTGPITGKLLTSKDKVWYQVCAAKSTDFVTTDTSIAGLYLFNNTQTSVDYKTMASTSISLYPNPARTHININSETEIVSYRIINVNGKEILSNRYTKQTIDISKLKQGVYYVEIKNLNNYVELKKLIKF